MQQTVLELFDSSDTVLEGKKAQVVALGPNMRRHGNAASGEEGLLGQLVWYSISDALRITPEALARGHGPRGHGARLPAPARPHRLGRAQ